MTPILLSQRWLEAFEKQNVRKIHIPLEGSERLKETCLNFFLSFYPLLKYKNPEELRVLPDVNSNYHICLCTPKDFIGAEKNAFLRGFFPPLPTAGENTRLLFMNAYSCNNYIAFHPDKLNAYKENPAFTTPLLLS